MPYFGVIQEIQEVDYSDFVVPIFQCQWVNGNIGVCQDKMGFTLLDLQKLAYKDEPFIMAKQVRQMLVWEGMSATVSMLRDWVA